MTTVNASTSSHGPERDDTATHLLVEIRQLLRDQRRLIEAVERVSKPTESEKAARTSGSHSRTPVPKYIDPKGFWDSVLPTDESIVRRFDVFISWLRSMRPFLTADVVAVVKPAIYADTLVDLDSLGEDDDAFADLKTRLRKRWPKAVPNFTRFAQSESRCEGWGVDTQDKLDIHHFLVVSPDDPKDLSQDDVHSSGCWANYDAQGPFDPNIDLDDMGRCGIMCIPNLSWPSRSEGVLGFDSIALIFEALGSRMSCGPSVRYHKDDHCGHNFLARHATPWSADEPRYWVDILGMNLHGVQLHMRSFVTETHSASPTSDSNPSGLRCEREFGTLSSIGGEFSLTERRYSLSLSLGAEYGPCGMFAIVLLVDPGPEGSARLNYSTVVAADMRRFGLQSCFLLTGLAVFQTLLCVSVEAWRKDWVRTLSRIDAALSVKVHQVLDNESRDRLMYDDTKLQRSAFYFSLLQLLRIFSVLINQTTADMESLEREHMKKLDHLRIGWGVYVGTAWEFSKEAPVIQQNWDAVLTLQRQAGSSLVDRISRKVNEIESLRDGLFNAQSVKEAVTGTQINQYLLVFTIVTLVYLPPTFICTFYGMHLFDIESDVAGTRRQFWAVFGAVSGVTYLLSVVLLSGIHQRSKLRQVLSRCFPPAADVVTSPGFDEKLDGDTSSGDASHAGILPRFFQKRKPEDKQDEEAGDKVDNVNDKGKKIDTGSKQRARAT